VAFSKTDFRNDLFGFDIPTLVIHGTDDKIVPKAMGINAAKAISGAIFKEYAGGPHGLFITHKQQLIEDLVQYLGDTQVERLPIFQELNPH
jgi:pimeloyl-ACP methyl ester carboxylesterase